jgi:hypothetical protein
MMPHTTNELIRFIEAAGENENIDAKGPVEWDGGVTSAGLTKDIISFANSRDGGGWQVRAERTECSSSKFVRDNESRCVGQQ